MNVRKQSGLPTTPPHIGDDDLLLDGATGLLHGRTNAGTIVPVVGYKSYVASVYQTGTSAPVVSSILRNDFDEAPTWAREEVGQFKMTFIHPVMTVLKSIVMITSRAPNVVVTRSAGGGALYVLPVSNYDLTTGAEVDEANFVIELRVYV